MSADRHSARNHAGGNGTGLRCPVQKRNPSSGDPAEFSRCSEKHCDCGEAHGGADACRSGNRADGRRRPRSPGGRRKIHHLAEHRHSGHPGIETARTALDSGFFHRKRSVHGDSGGCGLPETVPRGPRSRICEGFESSREKTDPCRGRSQRGKSSRIHESLCGRGNRQRSLQSGQKSGRP